MVSLDVVAIFVDDNNDDFYFAVAQRPNAGHGLLILEGF
jgi:hypothetical protein